MRPLQREQPNSGKKSFDPSRDAYPDLRKNFGDYCCYCEAKTPHSAQVEHFLPKSQYPEYTFCWENLLLACSTCNEKKGTKEIKFRPDKDNTFLVFLYKEGIGAVPNSKILTQEQREQAQIMIDVLGLSRDLSANKTTKRTTREALWEDRDQTWAKATRCKEILQQAYEKQNQSLIEKLKEDALDRAEDYFSVWMTVFADDPDMRNRFIKKFKGTATDCFDADGNPIPRPGGII